MLARRAIIETENLRKVFRIGKEKVVALDGVTFSVREGEICCLLGTSGSGKTTLLNILAGLDKPTSGRIMVCGKRLDKMNERRITLLRQKNMGFVFQSYNLLPHLTALENVAMPLTFRGVGARKRKKAAAEMLKQVGLGERMRHKPTQMSGGQQQRVGIARAFVAKPRIVFADEPTGNLDSKTTLEVMEMMVRMARENNLTLIIVTHDPEIAAYADNIYYMKDGQITRVDKENIHKTPEQEVPLSPREEEQSKEEVQDNL